MLDKIENIKKEISDYQIYTEEELEKFRLKYISRKGTITDLFESFKKLPPEEKRSVGKAINELKNTAQLKFKSLISQLREKTESGKSADIDLTLPPDSPRYGSIHPLTQVREKIVRIFEKIGFNVEDGPEVEDDWHNFTALNFPPNHPAREMQDTFFIKKKENKSGRNEDILLRTHTSNVQIRLMEKKQPPLRSIMPGRVYRNEAISARAHCIFHQVEGLYVSENVGFKDLKDTLFYFAREMFGKKIKLRFRPSFFPFTEPSAEIDISCLICGGEGCNVCKYSGWLEIAGSGMVDPNVLENGSIDPEKYTGFAFGMGIERIAMLKYQIRDLRLFTENDLRFLHQFVPVS